MLQRYRNRPGGFWCLQDDPAAARYAICGTEPLAGLDTVLAPTDGASRAYDLLEVMTPAGMIERARKGQLHEIAASGRSAEDDRLEDLARVGLKDHDDLTIVATKLPGAAVA